MKYFAKSSNVHSPIFCWAVGVVLILLASILLLDIGHTAPKPDDLSPALSGEELLEESKKLSENEVTSRQTTQPNQSPNKVEAGRDPKMPKPVLNPEHSELVIPDKSILQEEHFREEYGVNEYTTPSIKNLFDLLEQSGKIPYQKVKREGMIGKAPRDRALISLRLGTVIAEGFLIVQAEQYDDLEGVARDILSLCQLLGADHRVKPHIKQIQRLYLSGNKDYLKDELIKTQKDVENEMTLLRDLEVVHMISLAGWLRAFQISSTIILSDYSEEKSKILHQPNLAGYFYSELNYLEKKLGNKDFYKELLNHIQTLNNIFTQSQKGAYSKKEVIYIHELANKMVNCILEDKTATTTSQKPKQDKVFNSPKLELHI